MRVKPCLLAVISLFVIQAASYAIGKDQGDEKCPICRLPVKKDGPDLDFRVTMTRSGKNTAYRCILCALTDSKSIKDNLKITAASDKKGEPVTITRTNGKWTVSPEGALFAYAKGSHMQCQYRYRAVRSREAYESYAKTNAKYLESVKPLTINDLLKQID